MSSASFVYGGYPTPRPPPLPDEAGGEDSGLEFVDYQSEAELPEIVHLIEKELSEPYLIYNYRYFLEKWPQFCQLVYACQRTESDASRRVGGAIAVVVSKMERHLKGARKMRGYVAMLSVHTAWRGRGIARQLVERNVHAMVSMGAEEIVLETEVDNVAALALYESLNFIREKRLHRFYLNGKDAYRLVYPVPYPHRQHAAAHLSEVHETPSDQGAQAEPANVLLQTLHDSGAIA